ncbi:unnamed protein product [Linum trigynum]|uniref:Zinc knuckle CX2CX4HX4C domain-containing protein n=1 Tax=Linum trigynum TaxID=586398 RepID=A0AAV2G441_9ROSI
MEEALKEGKIWKPPPDSALPQQLIPSVQPSRPITRHLPLTEPTTTAPIAYGGKAKIYEKGPFYIEPHKNPEKIWRKLLTEETNHLSIKCKMRLTEKMVNATRFALMANIIKPRRFVENSPKSISNPEANPKLLSKLTKPLPLAPYLETATMEANQNERQIGHGHLVLNIQPQVVGARGGMSMMLAKWITHHNTALHKAKGAAQGKWKGHGEIAAQREARNLFVYSFPSEAGRDAVWAGRPWNMANTLVALKKWDGELNPEEVEFNTTAMWVQIHNIPNPLRDDDTVEAIASFVFPQFLKLDRTNTDARGWRRFFRVMVEVDFREPIPTGFEYPVGKRSVWVSFKYERLSDLCYFCGKIGHPIHLCEIREENRQKGMSIEPSGIYTAALKAGPDSPTCVPPPSFLLRNRIEEPSTTITAIEARLNSQYKPGETTPTALGTGPDHASPSGPPGFEGRRYDGQSLIYNSDFNPHGLMKSAYYSYTPRRLEEDLEAVADAVGKSLDLNIETTGKERGSGYDGLGQSSKTGGPPTTLNLMGLDDGPSATSNHHSLSLVQEVQMNYERMLGRAEKKRKPDLRILQDSRCSEPIRPTNLLPDFISFSPGAVDKGKQRRKLEQGEGRWAEA